ncbi:MAG TPA: 4-alpha-glucanotransferase, partial [Acidobacteriota bacterium]|nr:4-alpha-glucanotransferase [Acidobacteriota bacterium]
MSREQDSLHELAQLYQVETSFFDGLGILREPQPDVLLAVLKSLGAEIENLDEVPAEVRRRRRELLTRFADPVSVSWDGQAVTIPVQFSESDAADWLRLRIGLESGAEKRWELRGSDLLPRSSYDVDGEPFECRELEIPQLPFGYQNLEVETSSGVERVHLVSAPGSAFSKHADRLWGLFLPLYALKSEKSWGVGDLTDFQDFVRWIGRSGGRFVGTLPLFAAFLKEPLEPSPYVPTSRLFWNELFVDPTRAPQWGTCEEGRRVFESSEFQDELQCLRASELVDYGRAMAHKRKVLEVLARQFDEEGGYTSPDFREFLSRRPEAIQYAEFRAVHEKCRQSWNDWPERLRDGNFLAGDYEESSKLYHLYAQWLVDQQIDSLHSVARDSAVGVFLDLPLGVHPDGFDARLESSSFAANVSGGAPPDDFFRKGQDWGFRPPHPEKSRHLGHRYLREVLGQLMRRCDLIRVDHFMSLQRLYWIPNGWDPENGVYVNYPTEDLLAVLAVESNRHDCVVVGEDLGTVSPLIREQMGQHEIHRMYVGQFENSLEVWPPISPVAEGVVASLNTHDTPTAVAFWRGLDIDLRREMELLNEEEWNSEKKQRIDLIHKLQSFLNVEGDLFSPSAERAAVIKWIEYLAGSDARYVLVNLEDLWL